MEWTTRTHIHTRTQTFVQIKHFIVVQCRQVVGRHLVSGGDAILEGTEMLFETRRREKQKGNIERKGSNI